MSSKYTDEFIDQIVFGNATIQDLQVMKDENYLVRALAPDMRRWTPPKNSSRATKEELNILVEYSVTQEKNGRKQVFDQALIPYIEQLFVRNGADAAFVKKIAQEVVDDIIPIITLLKYTFNRPRPFQLAYYQQLRLHPQYSYFVSSPSFPSGHTAIAAVLCEVLGNHFPDSYEAMVAFRKEVSESRLYMGVHYPSDNNSSMMLSEKICGNPEFKIKFKL